VDRGSCLVGEHRVRDDPRPTHVEPTASGPRDPGSTPGSSTQPVRADQITQARVMEAPPEAAVKGRCRRDRRPTVAPTRERGPGSCPRLHLTDPGRNDACGDADPADIVGGVSSRPGPAPACAVTGVAAAGEGPGHRTANTVTST